MKNLCFPMVFNRFYRCEVGSDLNLACECFMFFINKYDFLVFLMIFFCFFMIFYDFLVSAPKYPFSGNSKSPVSYKNQWFLMVFWEAQGRPKVWILKPK